MTKKTISEIICDYIIEETMTDPAQFNSETRLFEEGIFDSMGFLLLIEFIREKFNVDTKDDELLLDNFDSVNTITAFISSRINQWEKVNVTAQ